MAALQRFTTEYIDAEDRLRLSGELGPQKTVVIWLSLRLLQRLLPHLLHWLQPENQNPVNAAEGTSHQGTIPTQWHDDAWHGFAQQAAQAQLPLQAPVVATHPQSVWLAHAIDVAVTPEQIQLLFKGAAGEQASLLLAPQPLRQWLGIVYTLWQRTEWPMQVWPQWMHDPLALAPNTAPTGLLH